jgi:hypothetical protein
MELILGLVWFFVRIVLSFFWWVLLFPIWMVLIALPVALMDGFISDNFKISFQDRFRKMNDIWKDFGPYLIP